MNAVRGRAVECWGGYTLAKKWPAWWEWELEFSPHLFKRMLDRRITALDVRDMLHRAPTYRKDVVPGRWVIVTSHRRKTWEVIVEPDTEAELLVVITAYPQEEP